jgi:hypothetical protein
MPQIARHVENSKARTGREHREIHEWIDDPEKKNHRHDVTKVMEFGRMFREKYGEQAVGEYVAHLHDDLKGKFWHVVEDVEKAAKKTAEGYMNVLRKLAGRPLSEDDLAIVEKDLNKGLSGLVDELSHLIEDTLIYFGVRDKSEDSYGVVEKESEAEERFEEILAANIRYGKNEPTLQRYLSYHKEIQELMANADS